MKTIEIIENEKSLKKFNIYINGKKKSKKILSYTLTYDDELSIVKKNFALNPFGVIIFFIIVLISFFAGAGDDMKSEDAREFATLEQMNINYKTLKQDKNKVAIDKRSFGIMNDVVCIEFDKIINEKVYNRYLKMSKNAKRIVLTILLGWLIGISIAIAITVIISKT